MLFQRIKTVTVFLDNLTSAFHLFFAGPRLCILFLSYTTLIFDLVNTQSVNEMLYTGRFVSMSLHG